MSAPVETTSRARKRPALTTLALVGALAFSFVCAAALNRRLDERRPSPTQTFAEDQPLYGSDEALRRMSLGFNGVVADWYWMRSLQYVGRKIINYSEAHPGQAQFSGLGELDLKLLSPLLERTTTLDPNFLVAYEYGGMVLSAFDEEAAIRLLRKGIEHNPSEWRLYQHLGYVLWQRQDYAAASEAYGAGGRLPGAPVWMTAMSARMLAEGGSRATAREMYLRMYHEAQDENVRRMAELRLLQVEALDELDAVRRALRDYRQRAGRCPAGWREAVAELRMARVGDGGRALRLDHSGAPLDPAGTPYVLTKDGCDADLNPQSRVPGR